MAKKPEHDRRPEVMQSDKWLRVYVGGKVVADSKKPLLLRAQGQLPVYYFPEEDVRMAHLQPAAEEAQVAAQGEGPWPEPPQGRQLFDVEAGGRAVPGAAWRVTGAPPEHEALEGHIAFAWAAMDAWYEEDWQIRVHPHDPYHRIDVRPSSRTVRVEVESETVAETERPVIVFETGLPPRYYIPKMDVRMDRLRLSEKTTHCAYKGTAPHYSLNEEGSGSADNIAWYYPFPAPGFEQIQNLIAFYQELVEVYVDGQRVAG
ncbi:MAG: DUF427 domain-containing protein [Candidatus Promineifilaceae bacterium]|nr:DUF427 domain-containing protein [Candidatus Promineifilaceae bacterium]